MMYGGDIVVCGVKRDFGGLYIGNNGVADLFLRLKVVNNLISYTLNSL
jgi:hypothetical protein